MKKIVPLFVLVTLITLSSCSRITIVRKENWESVLNSLDTIHLTLVQLDSMMNVRDQEMKAARIEQEFSTQRLAEKIDQISRDVSQTQSRISEISRKTGKISKHIREKAVQDSLRSVQEEEDKVAAFKYAMQEFRGGHMKEAYDAFESYMKSYPDDKRLHEALYWRAEAAFAQQDYPVAEALFKQYYASYREEELVCAVLYKWGTLYDSMENKEAYRDHIWKQLLEYCPNSKEAKLVEARKASN